MNAGTLKTLALNRNIADLLVHRKRLPSLLQRFIRRQSSSDNALEWSYVMKPGKWPLLGLTVGRVMDRAEDLFGDREAVVCLHQNIRKTFSEVKKDSDAVAAGLVAMGLQRGERLGIWGSNSYQWYLTQFAAAKAGLILVNINPAYRLDELRYCLNKVGVKAIVCDEQFKTSRYYEMLCKLVPEIPESGQEDLQSSEIPYLKKVFVNTDSNLRGVNKFQDLIDAGDSSHAKAIQKLSSEIQFDEACNIQFTSGTTGLPKGATLSHHMIVNNAFAIGKRSENDKMEHRICLSVPLYHCFGCVAGTLVGALFGATCVMPSAGFDPEAIVSAFQDERITSCYGTPTMFVDILNAQRHLQKDLGSLSTGIMAGAPCPQELVTAVMEDLSMKDFLVMYGMTETSPVTFQCFPKDSPDIRSSTIGYPGDHIEVKVVDEKGDIVPAGQAGELYIRGYCNFLGYWDDVDKTAEAMTSDRWLKTGDQAVLRPDGYGQIIGRLKDMIIRGGENIYPAELENFLMGHPDISEAQVFGLPDKRMGEEVAAWIRKAEGSNLTEADLKEWCRGKIAHYKIPRNILFKEEFPRTVTGKIMKFKMRDWTLEELNL